MVRVAASFMVACVMTPVMAAPDRVAETFAEEAANEWVVIPKRNGLSAEKLEVVARFVRQQIALRAPELEFKGVRPGGGLHYGARSGLGPEKSRAISATLERLAGVTGAMAVPSRSQLLRSRMATLARGEADSRAAGLIVRYREGTAKRSRAKSLQLLDADEIALLSRAAGQEIDGMRVMSGESFVLDFSQHVDIYTAELASQRLALHPQIEFAAPNGYLVPALTSTDPLFVNQWNLTNAVSGINVTDAWTITTGASDVIIAVVDSGLLPHPEFASRVLPGYDFISSATSAGDGDGRDADFTDAGDWRPAGWCGATDAGRAASTWHGTHVAGILGASGNNGIGIAGVSWNAKILPVRVLGKCGALESDVLDGMRWAAGYSVPGVPTNQNPAWVINMSLGGSGNCLIDKTPFQIAVLESLANGASIVVAAGNDNESALTRVPASCIGTVKVAATGPDGDRTSYSNFSASLEVAAPGGSFTAGSFGILSSVGTGQQEPGSPGWASKQGTSMAAPHVAGVASLMLSANPFLTVAQVRDILRDTSYPFPAGSFCDTNAVCGLGIVDAAEAVKLSQKIVQPINFSDIWWVPAESGWGLNLQQQGNILFGTWFTFGPDGKPAWYVMSNLERLGQDFFIGDIHQATGVPFAQINGAPAARSATQVGAAIVAFFGYGYDPNPNVSFDSAIFFYEIGATTGIKPIQRYTFSDLTACIFSNTPRANATNYQDLWWKPDESGWGLNIAHQGDIFFATWFTYDAAGANTWLTSDMTRTGPRTYSGQLYRATGTPYDQIRFEPAIRTATVAGSITMTFTNGESGKMDYVLDGVPGSKAIQRFVFSSPLSFCIPL